MSLVHDLRCKTLLLADMVSEAEAAGEEVPESVKREAERGFGMMRCHEECPVRRDAVARGIELAERYG